MRASGTGDARLDVAGTGGAGLGIISTGSAWTGDVTTAFYFRVPGWTRFDAHRNAVRVSCLGA